MLGGTALFQGLEDLLAVIAVGDPDHVPAVGGKTGAHVLAEGDVGIALDGDLIVIVEQGELVQVQGPGQRGGLGGDALHHAAVAADGIGAVIHDGEAGAVEMLSQEGLRDGKADRVGHALPQRSGGDFNAAGLAVLGMAGGPGTELAELLEVLDGQAVTAQVKQDIQQGAGVSAGEDEAVPVLPAGISGIVTKNVKPECTGHGGHAHGSTGMTGVGFLDGIRSKSADGVHGFLFD